MTKLVMAIIANALASIFAFAQLQGWVVFPNKPFLKSMWWIYLMSIIIAPLFFYSTKWSYEHFGAFWNMRLAGFGIGTLTFGFLTLVMLGEIPTLKTIICFLLALAIILIQITNLT